MVFDTDSSELYSLLVRGLYDGIGVTYSSNKTGDICADFRIYSSRSGIYPLVESPVHGGEFVFVSTENG